MEPDFTDVLAKSTAGVAVAEASNQVAKRRRPVIRLNAAEALENIKDTACKAMAFELVSKAINSYDLSGIRLVSQSDEISVLANGQTVTHDIIRANGSEEVTDFQHKWLEEYAGNDTVEFFNLNGENPSEAEMDRGMDSNTTGFFGNKVNLRMITKELAKKNKVDEYARQIRMQLLRMKRFLNDKLISNTEVTAETTMFDPQWRGLVTGITAAGATTILADGSDFTAPILDDLVLDACNAASNDGAGIQTRFVLLTGSPNQLEVFRTLMISRYTNAESSLAYMQTQDQLAATLPNVPIPSAQARIYQPTIGMPLVIIYEPQMNANTAVLVDPTDLYMGDFSLEGSIGPWIVERPTEELTYLYVAFDGKNLIHRLRLKTKSQVITGLR